MAKPAQKPGGVPGLALLACLGLPALFAAALFAPALFQGQVLWGSDEVSLGLPLMSSAHRALAAGSLPLWCPELCCGLPNLASYNLNFLHPFWLARALMGLAPAQGFAWDGALELCLAAWGSWLFLRWLSASRRGALVGALAFALSGTQLSPLFAGHTNNVEAIALIPWGFWGLGRALGRRYDDAEGGRAWGWALMGAVLALQVYAQGLQVAAYLAPALAGWALWRAASFPAPGLSRPRSLAWAGAGLALALLLAGLLSAPQWLPTARYLPWSWRQDMDYATFTSWSFNPQDAITFLVPGFFGWADRYWGAWPFNLTSEYLGLLPWALALAALAAAWRSPRHPARALAALAAAALLVGLGKNTPLHLLFYRLPVYHGFRSWVRALCLFNFSIAMAAGLGWDALARAASPWPRRAAMAWAGLALLAGALAWLLAGQAGALGAARGGDGLAQVIRDSALHALLAGALLMALLWLIRARARWAGLVLLAAALALLAWDLQPMHQRFLRFVQPEQLLQPPPMLAGLPDPQGLEPYRVFIQAGSGSAVNQAAALGFEELGGYHGMKLAGWTLLEQALAQRPLEFLRLGGARYAAFSHPVDLPWLKPLPGQANAYQNLLALPRAFLANQSFNADSQAQAISITAMAPLTEPLLAVVEAGPTLSGDGRLRGSVQWLDRKPLSLALQVQAPEHSLLVITQSFSPGWSARVDGRPAPLLRCYGALQAVELSPGSHRVELSYSEPALAWGLGLAGLGLLLALGLILFKPPTPALRAEP
jgi:hypothetical protein